MEEQDRTTRIVAVSLASLWAAALALQAIALISTT
jgi:hypothetical protein